MSTPRQQRVTELLTALFDYDEKNLSSFSNSVQRANELEYPIPGERGMQLENMRFILSNRDSLLESVPQASEQILTYMEKDLLSTLQYVGYTTANPYMIENLRSMTASDEQTTYLYFNAMLKEEALRRLDENRAELETIRKSYCEELDAQRWARLRETRARYDSLEDKIIEIADDNTKLEPVDESTPERFAKTWAAHKEGLARLEAVNQERSNIVRSMPEITYLPRNYQRKENEQLTSKLSKGFEWVKIAQEQVRQSILDDTMNLWEITPVVVSVLERMKPNARELAAIEQKMISDQKKENRFKIGTVALSAAATIACFFLSGGAATALQLAAKAGAVTVATAGGIVMGVDELANALETERMVYASMYSKENGAFTNEDIVSAKNGTRATAFYFALDIFGTFEAVQAWKMLNRFNGLSSRTQDVLGTLKNGKKVLSAIDQTSDPIKTAEVLNVMKEHGTLSTLEKITDETKLRQALTLVPDNPRATAIFIECGIDAERVAAIENSALARLSTIHTNYAALKYDTSNGDICSLMTDLFMKEGDFSELEMAALIKAQLEGKIDIPSVLMRVQVNNEYVTLYDSRKSLAWATDPYLFAGKLKDNNNFRELCGLERSTDTKLYVDVVLFRNGAQNDLVLDTISADRIKFDTKEGLRNLIKRYEGATGDAKVNIQDTIIAYSKQTSVSTNQIFIPKGNTYTLNESFLDNEYLRYLGVKAPGNDGPSLLVVNGKRLEGTELERFESAFEMVNDTTGCNLRFTGEDFTIQNSGSIGVNEYGILKTDANFDIDAINKAGDARVVRIMIDTAVQNPHFVVIKQGGN